MRIRLANIEDVETLAEIHSASFNKSWAAEDFNKFLSKPDVYHCFIADRKDNNSTGFILISLIGSEAEIMTLCVLPHNRARGIAKSLMEHTITFLGSGNASVIYLEVAKKNTPALSLYRSFGFEGNGIRKAYIEEEDGTFTDAYMMKYELN